VPNSPIRRSTLVKVGVTAATAIAMLLAATPAQAHTPTGTHTVKIAPRHHPAPAPGKHHPGKPLPKKAVVSFTADGLVVAHTASTVTVLAHDLRIGKTVRHNQLITANAAPGHRYTAKVTTSSGSTTAADAVIGDRMTISGSVTGSGAAATFTAAAQEQHSTPGHAYLGTVESVNGSMITVSKGPKASDNAEEDNNGQDTFTIDVSAAAVLIDGAPGALTPGQTVVVLGEGDHDTILAAAVYAYTTAPTVIAGEVTAVTGSTLTIGDQDNPTIVDLTAAALVIDGQPNPTPAALTAADTAQIVGTTDTTGTVTPTTAFVFTTHDTQPLPGSDTNND